MSPSSIDGPSWTPRGSEEESKAIFKKHRFSLFSVLSDVGLKEAIYVKRGLFKLTCNALLHWKFRYRSMGSTRVIRGLCNFIVLRKFCSQNISKHSPWRGWGQAYVHVCSVFMMPCGYIVLLFERLSNSEVFPTFHSIKFYNNLFPMCFSLLLWIIEVHVTKICSLIGGYIPFYLWIFFQ